MVVYKNMEDRRKIAVLIDSDNFAIKYYSILKDELDQIGDIVIARAYGNFDKDIKKDFANFGINPILQTPYTPGKNASDIRIVIDAIELLSERYIDCFCLATSDSDFTPLAMRLKEKNMVVIGAGEAKTPDPLKKVCHQFINVDEIYINAHKPLDLPAVKTTKKETKSKEDNTDNLKIAQLVKTISGIIESEKYDDGFALFSDVITQLQKKKTDFNPKNYGAVTSKSLPFFKQFLSAYFEFKNEGTIYRIKQK
jgi:uncharacterized protein (TIGR00288 family)